MGTNINADIYDLHEVATDLQKQYMPNESDRTRAIGIYGYLADAHATQLQNSVIVASEMGNELWPERAKFEKNVITHAIYEEIANINAEPAKMRVYIGITEKSILNLLENHKMVLDKESVFLIGNFEFHLQYDLEITQNIIENNEVIYTARYIMDRNNILSDIINPYIGAPFMQYYNNERYLLLDCELMQVEHEVISKKVLTNNVIENKTFEFEFENQLASFEVAVTESGKTTHLTPVFEGSAIDQTLEKFCYYSYIEANRIRVIFDSLSYVPGVNAQINVLVKTTQGASGNFEFNTNLYTTIDSDNYGYKNMSVYLIIGSDSKDGKDRKSIEELRKELPKEALSRGSITNAQDLTNYFNTFASEFVRIQTQKKVDNQFERTYYAHMVMKDSYDNVIPTNTINLLLYKDTDFDTIENRKHVLKPGCIIALDDSDPDDVKGRILKPASEDENGNIELNDQETIDAYLSDASKFLYTVPLMTTVTNDPLYVSYYKTMMKYSALLDFSKINDKAPVQFISTGVVWRRNYTSNQYTLDISFAQNILTNKDIVVEDENGRLMENKLKVVAVIYNKGENDDSKGPYRYILPSDDDTSYDIQSTFTYDYKFRIETTDHLNDESKLKITNAYNPGQHPNTPSNNSYVSGDVDVKIYVLAKFNAEYGREDLDSIVPGLDGYSVTNIYNVRGGLRFFENFSNIISSQVTHLTHKSHYETKQGYYLKNVPVVRYTYADNEESIQELISEMVEAKAYIDQGVMKLENNFGIDFKFFNTYGPSRTYSLDKDGKEIIDRVNLSLEFEVKLTKSADNYTKEYIIRDIKEMIEDLNNLSHLHIPNLITEITNKYRPNSIEYIEFMGFNKSSKNYGPGEQHLYRHEYDGSTIKSIVPEFLCINTTDGMSADITINVV